ncbi:MAG: DUF1016 family protein [Bacteroidales bacterium]|nr:DUF1016 family protein [Bacteroidales bacterium]
MKETKPAEKQFEQIRDIILNHRSKALRSVNEESLLMSWHIGRIISERINSNEWGSKVVTQLSEYLRTKDPSLKGFSRRNIYNMVAFYEAYSNEAFIEYSTKLPVSKYLNQTNEISEIVHPKTAQMNSKSEIVQNSPAQFKTEHNIVQTETVQMPPILILLTFSKHTIIINNCKTIEERIFYILYAYRENLNYNELQRCIDTNTFASLLGNKKNLSKGLLQTYPQANVMLKDTAFVDFLNLPAKHSEKQLHKGILENMKKFILELGKDFLYIDSEYHLQVGASTFKIDLLFFHRGLQCLVAIELKSTKFKPEYIGQLEFYLEALDRDVKRSNENPSIGILLCQSADKSVVEYAMSRSLSPTMIAEYKSKLIPKETLQESFNDFVNFLENDK